LDPAARFPTSRLDSTKKRIRGVFILETWAERSYIGTTLSKEDTMKTRPTPADSFPTLNAAMQLIADLSVTLDVILGTTGGEPPAPCGSLAAAEYEVEAYRLADLWRFAYSLTKPALAQGAVKAIERAREVEFAARAIGCQTDPGMAEVAESDLRRALALPRGI
jgi:hypothetical protein